jgi:phosphorylase/glycogen(starch) synthase
MSKTRQPDYLFETSWEICNKIGGIHTVIATKAQSLKKTFGDNLIMIGPDALRNSEANHEFEEDRTLFPQWLSLANQDGFRVRTGRWKIEGNPIAILVDFTTLMGDKNKVLAELWEEYHVDSIAGQWDYVEPAIFGYAAGKVIEHFAEYHLSPRHSIVAHFHEWMTGSGVLYLKKHAPWVATAFTTHATTIGRSICGNGIPLYKNMKNHDVEHYVSRFQMTAKYSLEKNSAHHADVFTTVSEITAEECKYLLNEEVDYVTPNGFDMRIVPEKEQFDLKRNAARDRIFEVLDTLYGKTIDRNALIVLTSGRYEYRNKGIDVFIKAFEKLVKNNPKKDIIPLFLIPSGHGGVRNELIQALQDKNKEGLTQPFLTHVLHNRDHDPIVNNLCSLKLHENGPVYPLFIPCYLNGADGLFNMEYYDMLTAADVGVFPSYYEPWGYTPLESMAYGVPAITTTLAGYGIWINQDNLHIDKGAAVIDRTDDNDDEVVDSIVAELTTYIDLDEKGVEGARNKATEIAKGALWENLIENYEKSYADAIEKSSDRHRKPRPHKEVERPQLYSDKINNEPGWKKMVVQSSLPDELSGLLDITQNLWWTWNFEATQLFKYMDEELMVCK